MAMSEKEKKKLMEDINDSIASEKANLLNDLQAKTEPEVMLNKVRQFRANLQKIFEENSLDQEKDMYQFVWEKIYEIGQMEVVVYRRDPSLFVREADKATKKVEDSLNICLIKNASNRDFSKNILRLANELNNLKFLIDMVCRFDLTADETVMKKVNETKMKIAFYEEKYSYLEKAIPKNTQKGNNQTPNAGSNQTPNGGNNKDSLVDIYIKNLTSSKQTLINNNPSEKAFIENTLVFLNTAKGMFKGEDLKNLLNSVRAELMNKCNYDIETNTFSNRRAQGAVVPVNNQMVPVNNLGNQNTNNSNQPNNGNQQGNNLTTKEKNRYIALASTIDEYLSDLRKNAANILNNKKIKGGYDAKSEEFGVLTDKLTGLYGMASNCSAPYDDIKDEFDKTVNYIKHRFGYVYKQKQQGRRRGIKGVVRLGLGVGGFIIGGHGIAQIIRGVLFYSKFGLLHAVGNPFLTPSLIVAAGITLLIAAASMGDKGFITRIHDWLKGKREDRRIERMEELEDQEDVNQRRRRR